MNHQLHLPLHDTWNPATVSRLNRRQPLATVRVQVGAAVLWLHVRTTARTAEVQLRCDSDAPGATELCLKVAFGPIFLTSTSSDSVLPLYWSLGRSVRLSDPRDFFGYSLRWGVAKLGWRAPRGWTLPIRAALALLLREAADALSAKLSAPLRAATSPFPPPLRATIYGRLVRDERGWLAQAMRSTPGAILYAIALTQQEETEEAGVRLAIDLKLGRRLDEALSAANEAWHAALLPWARGDSRFGDAARRAFAAASDGEVEAGAELKRSQRLLVRRAGPQVEPHLLLLPPPVRLIPEDIPRDPASNGAWFRAMKVAGVTLAATGLGLPEAHARAFAAFASRNARTLLRAPPGLPLEVWLGEVSAALHERGQVPSRTTDAEALLASIDIEAIRREPRAPPRRFVHPLDGRAPDDTAAQAPADAEPGLCARSFKDWAREGIKVRQLTTLRELSGQGARQHNCVADYSQAVAAGEVLVFAVEVLQKELTMALVRRMGRLLVSEFKGFANRRASRAEWEALGAWLRTTGVVR